MTEEEKKAPEQAEAAAPEAEEKKEEVKEEAAAVAPAADEATSEEAEVEVPEQFKKLVEQVESMSVLELNELVKVLEKKFGVSATAVAVAGAAGGDAGAEEKNEFTVELKDAGSSKIGVIKAVKEVLGLGLKEAKDIVESAPATLKDGVKKEEAETIKAKIEEAGGTVELK